VLFSRLNTPTITCSRRPSCVELAVACTKAAYRGMGIGWALTRQGLAVARESGYRRCLVDWRSTSLLSCNFWPEQASSLSFIDWSAA